LAKIEENNVYNTGPWLKQCLALPFREKEEKEQQKLSLMLIFVVLVFMLCNVLAMVSNILEAFKVCTYIVAYLNS
jgi:hypothetical protein